MASIRHLKKEIDWFYSMVLNDCFFVLKTENAQNKEKVIELAGKVIEKHREMRSKVNHPVDKGKPKELKKFYKTISKELSDSVDEFLTKLSKNIK